MVDTRLDRRVDRPQQVVVGLPRRAVDEVQTDVFEAGSQRLAGRVRRPVRCVYPVENPQHAGRDRLHAQRHPRVAGLADRCEKLRPCRFGVGLGGDFGVRRQREVLAHHVEQSGQTLTAQ